MKIRILIENENKKDSMLPQINLIIGRPMSLRYLYLSDYLFL